MFSVWRFLKSTHQSRKLSNYLELWYHSRNFTGNLRIINSRRLDWEIPSADVIFRTFVSAAFYMWVSECYGIFFFLAADWLVHLFIFRAAEWSGDCDRRSARLIGRNQTLKRNWNRNRKRNRKPGRWYAGDPSTAQRYPRPITPRFPSQTRGPTVLYWSLHPPEPSAEVSASLDRPIELLRRLHLTCENRESRKNRENVFFTRFFDATVIVKHCEIAFFP